MHRIRGQHQGICHCSKRELHEATIKTAGIPSGSISLLHFGNLLESEYAGYRRRSGTPDRLNQENLGPRAAVARVTGLSSLDRNAVGQPT
jgi:hypothetical protein